MMPISDVCLLHLNDEWIILFLFLFFYHIYALVLCYFYIIFYYFALSTEWTWFDVDFTSNYTLYNLLCDK